MKNTQSSAPPTLKETWTRAACMAARCLPSEARIAVKHVPMFAPKESAIPPAYIKRLQKLYDAWIDRYALSPIITVPTDKMDYVTDLIHAHDLVKLLERYVSGEL